MKQLKSTCWVAAIYVGVSLLTNTAEGEGEPFRPEAGKFPPLENALTYRGELVFVDHANRRGADVIGVFGQLNRRRGIGTANMDNHRRTPRRLIDHDLGHRFTFIRRQGWPLPRRPQREQPMHLGTKVKINQLAQSVLIDRAVFVKRCDNRDQNASIHLPHPLVVVDMPRILTAKL